VAERVHLEGIYKENIHKESHEEGGELRHQAWLALDTATANMTVAVMRGLDVIAGNESAVERNHSVRLVPEIQDLLRQAGIRMRDIRAIAIGRGPGSYTGVRIGVTVGKTLAWSLGVPIVSVSSTGALAFGYVRESQPEGLTWIVPMLDARRRQVFTGLYAWADDPEADVPDAALMPDPVRPAQPDAMRPADAPAIAGHAAAQDGADADGFPDGEAETIRFAESGLSGTWKLLAKDRIVLFADWAAQLCRALQSMPEPKRPKRIVFVGETDAFREDASSLHERTGVPVLIANQYVHARDIACLAWNRLLRKEADDVHGLVPNYTQLAEAEQKLLSRQT